MVVVVDKQSSRRGQNESFSGVKWKLWAVLDSMPPFWRLQVRWKTCGTVVIGQTANESDLRAQRKREKSMLLLQTIKTSSEIVVTTSGSQSTIGWAAPVDLIL